jgi:act minimal PKS acyl carrier protein
MADQEFTLPDLRRVIRESAGEVEELNGDILDLEFEEMGYDSLALLETAGAIERQWGIRLEEEAFAEARTPRTLLAVVNAQLSAAGAA